MGRLEQSVSGLLNTTNSALDQVTALAKTVLCLPKAFSNFVKGFYAISAKTIVGEIVGGVTQIVGQIVQGIVGNVIETIEQQLNKILDYLNDISNSINAIKNFINGIGERGQELVDIIKNDQNCSASNSSFFSCMATAAVNQLTNKAVSKINNKIQNATNDITNQITNKITQSGGVFDNIVNRQANAIDKITKQVNILL